MSEPLPVLPVHLVGIGDQAAEHMSRPRRRRRERIVSTFRTYLTAANDKTGAQLILPPSPNRILAQITPQGPVGSSGTASSHGWINTTAAAVQSQDGAHITSSGQGPIVTKTQGPLYLMSDPSASAVMNVVVVADYEGEPRFTKEGE